MQKKMIAAFANLVFPIWLLISPVAIAECGASFSTGELQSDCMSGNAELELPEVTVPVPDVQVSTPTVQDPMPSKIEFSALPPVSEAPRFAALPSIDEAMSKSSNPAAVHTVRPPEGDALSGKPIVGRTPESRVNVGGNPPRHKSVVVQPYGMPEPATAVPITVPVPRFAPVELQNQAGQTSTPESSKFCQPVEIDPEFRRRAARHVEQGNTLARRGATATAHGKFVQALVAIADGRDSVRPGNCHNKSLELALQIGNDVQDFFADSSTATTLSNPSFVSGTHVCGVVTQDEAATMTLTAIRQRYLDAMKKHFAAACGNDPVAAAALSSMGKLYAIKLAESGSSHECEWNIAMTFLETALACDRGDARSANEMGVLLVRAGEYGKAREMFETSLAIKRHPTTLKNLAALHEHLGEQSLADRALNEAEQLAVHDRSSGNSGIVQWVDPQAFGASPEEFDPMQSPRTASAENARQPVQSENNIFQNLFKR